MLFIPLLYYNLFTPTLSHLILNTPYTWGINDGITLEEPLTTSTTNWICAGQSPPPNAPIMSLVAGNTYNFQTICGEKDFNSPGCLIGDWHSNDNVDDYSGCALGISYTDYLNPNTHKYISYTHNCPKKTSNVSFTINKFIQNCDKCVCSWAWAPSIDYSSPQFYHNCFYCKITNGIGNVSTMKNMDFINVKNSQFNEITYNQLPNLSFLYQNTINNVTNNNLTNNPITHNNNGDKHKNKNDYPHHNKNINKHHNKNINKHHNKNINKHHNKNCN